MKGTGKTRLLVSPPISTFEFEAQLPTLMRRSFSAAREHDMAVMLSFDFHVAWKTRPDLWKLVRSRQAGLQPRTHKIQRRVHGWDGPPNKASYLNWGGLERRRPRCALPATSARRPRSRGLSPKVIAPVLTRSSRKLKAEGGRSSRGSVGGSEPVIDDYSKTDAERTKMMQEDGGRRPLRLPGPP